MSKDERLEQMWNGKEWNNLDINWRPTDRKTDRQTDRQTDRLTECQSDVSNACIN